MAEASKIRLVRCPKCGNLLSELPDYSVYECGGCGTFLRAKKKASASDGFLEKSNKEKNVESHTKLEDGSENSLGNLSEIEAEGDGVEVCRRKNRVLVEGNVTLVSVSSSITEDKEVLLDREDINAKKDSKGLRLSPSNSETEIRHVDKRGQSLKHSIDVWVGLDDQDSLNRSKSVNSSVVKGTAEVSAQSKTFAAIMNSRVIVDKSGVEKVGFWGFGEDPGGVPEHSRFPPFACPDEGPSNYKPNSVYGYSKPMENFGYVDSPNIVGNIEQDRPELLRKLNELKEQISRLEEKPRETIPDGKKMAPSEFYGGHAAFNVSMQPSARGNCVPKPSYFNHSHGHASFMNDHNLDIHSFHPHQRYARSMIPGANYEDPFRSWMLRRLPNQPSLRYPPQRRRHAPSMIPGANYEDPFQSQMLRRLPNQPSLRYPPEQPLEYFSGCYMDFNHDLLLSCSQEPFRHQPACSCLNCSNKNLQVPPKVPGTGFGNGRIANDPMRSNSYLHINPVKFGPRNYDPLGVPPLYSQDPQPHSRWPTDFDSDVEGFYYSHPKREIVVHGKRRISRPIAGGAPFMTCCKCLELLKLPRKIMTMANNMQKIQCGTCSIVYSIELKNKRLVISAATEAEQISAKADDGSRHPFNGGISSYSSNACGTNSCSVDFDYSGYNFQSIDTKQNFLSEDQTFNLSESEKRQDCASSSSISNEEENSLDSVIVQRDVSNSSELPSINDMSLTISGSNFSDHVDDSSSIRAVSITGKENRSKRVDEEKVVLNNFASQNSFEKDASAETEVEVSFNEYLSHDSVVASREEDQPRIKKGQKTFLLGLIKKSFIDLSRSNQNRENERPNVSVNGKCIPNRLVKKAEKLAGPIEAGDYWYDFQAGFWGVMGQPCLGIVIPFIEEFNYPMPENCAAGNTGVFVNGRELHQIDLDLLASRGLPITRDKNYIIEFSGRIVDKECGKELDNLGKLAPTVEKLKRGFGMRVPQVAF